jgi:hypothetical protein
MDMTMSGSGWVCHWTMLSANVEYPQLPKADME